MTEAEWLASADPAAMLIHLGSGASPRKLRLFACACCRQVRRVPCGHCGGKGGGVYGLEETEWTCEQCHGTGRTGGLTDPRSRRAVEVAERYADGEATEEDLLEARKCLYQAHAETPESYQVELSFECELAWRCASRIEALADNNGLPRWFGVSTKLAPIQAALLRCVFGNPFRPVGEWYKGDPDRGVPSLPPKWLYPLLTPAVVLTARAIYDERRFADLGILADALEEAGCEAEVDEPSPGWYRCRGCGKEWKPIHKYDDCGGGAKCEGLAEPLKFRRVLNPLLAHLRSGGLHARGCWVLDLILGK